MRNIKCANYERDNEILSEMEQNIKDYFIGKEESSRQEYIKDVIRDVFMMNADTIIDSKAGLFLKKQPCQDIIVESVRQKLLDRSNVGIKKYNTTLQDNNSDNYLNHLQMEMLDGVDYIEKLLHQKRDITQLVGEYPNDADLGKTIRKIYGET